MLNDSRKSSRVPYEAEFQITWNVEGSHNSGVARCIDLSTGGLRVRTAQPIPIGSYITLHSEDTGITVAGWVRHCTPDGESHGIGVEYTRSTRDELFGFAEEQESV